MKTVHGRKLACKGFGRIWGMEPALHDRSCAVIRKNSCFVNTDCGRPFSEAAPFFGKMFFFEREKPPLSRQILDVVYRQDETYGFEAPKVI